LEIWLLQKLLLINYGALNLKNTFLREIAMLRVHVKILRCLIDKTRFLTFFIALSIGWIPSPASAEEDGAQKEKSYYAIRSNRSLLGTAIDLANCIDSRQRLNPRSKSDFKAIIPELHAGHRFSLRLASWSKINSGVFDENGPDTKRLIRAQITFRLLGADGLVPLLYDENGKRYLPACAGEQSAVNHPNNYPTILMTLDEGALSSEKNPVSAEGDFRRRLAQHITRRNPPLFIGDAPGMPDGAMPVPSSMPEPRIRDWVKAVFATGHAAFLDGWPSGVVLTLDDASSIGDLSSLRLEHRGSSITDAPSMQGVAAPPSSSSITGTPAPPDAATVNSPPSSPQQALKGGHFIISVPEIFAGHDLTARIRETGGRCASDWRRVADDSRAYEVECRHPPPYDVAIGQLAAIRSEQANRIIRIDEMVLLTDAPLTEDWPKTTYPNAKGRIGPLPLKEFLQSGARLPMFDNAPQESASARFCSAKIDGDLSFALDGSASAIPAPCIVKSLALPPAWTQRVKGAPYPVTSGCFEGGQNGGCLQPPDGNLIVKLDFGPGWELVQMTASQIDSDAVAKELRPVWPYADNPVSGPVAANVSPDRLELLGVSYCYDARGEHCCAEEARRQEIQFLKDRPPLLPSLADAGCRSDHPLPHFAVAEFQRVDPGSLLHRFRRYWTISAVAGRPYSIPRQETIRIFPIRFDADRLPQKRDGWRVSLFSNLLSCQTRDSGSGGLDSFPFTAEGIGGRQVSLPIFALVAGPDGPVSQCSEGTVRPDASGVVVFSLIPQSKEVLGRR
jgi:hypothetical protein